MSTWLHMSGLIIESSNIQNSTQESLMIQRSFLWTVSHPLHWRSWHHGIHDYGPYGQQLSLSMPRPYITMGVIIGKIIMR